VAGAALRDRAVRHAGHVRGGLQPAEQERRRRLAAREQVVLSAPEHLREPAEPVALSAALHQRRRGGALPGRPGRRVRAPRLQWCAGRARVRVTARRRPFLRPARGAEWRLLPAALSRRAARLPEPPLWRAAAPRRRGRRLRGERVAQRAAHAPRRPAAPGRPRGAPAAPGVPLVSPLFTTKRINPA